MENLKLAPQLLGKADWVSGKSHEEMNLLTYIQLREDGSVHACYKDNSCMDVSDLFPSTMIDNYRSHDILIRY